jgi:hypothetical protein
LQIEEVPLSFLASHNEKMSRAANFCMSALERRGRNLMKESKGLPILAMLLAITLWTASTSAQVALPTASRPMELSAFGGVSGVYTGLAGGKNLSVTAGADVTFLLYHRLRPSIEVRGTYPMNRGRINAQKSILGGVKFDFLFNNRLHPYGNILVGRGQMNYGAGYLYHNNIYILTTTNVISPGAGFDYDLSDNLAIKVDGQFQHWGYAPTSSGSIYSKVGTVAVIYRFNLGQRHRR